MPKVKESKVKELIDILVRIDRCSNMSQICFLFDNLPAWVKEEIQKENDDKE